MLKSQDNEINNGLDRMKISIANVKDNAEIIGTSVDMQNVVLNNMGNRADKDNAKLAKLGIKLRKVKKNASQLNIGCWIFGILIIAGCIYGFLSVSGTI